MVRRPVRRAAGSRIWINMASVTTSQRARSSVDCARLSPKPDDDILAAVDQR
jgi:hypothetical protein